jgi:hypothetical protein
MALLFCLILPAYYAIILLEARPDWEPYMVAGRDFASFFNALFKVHLDRMDFVQIRFREVFSPYRLHSVSCLCIQAFESSQ